MSACWSRYKLKASTEEYACEVCAYLYCGSPVPLAAHAAHTAQGSSGAAASRRFLCSGRRAGIASRSTSDSVLGAPLTLWPGRTQRSLLRRSRSASQLRHRSTKPRKLPGRRRRSGKAVRSPRARRLPHQARLKLRRRLRSGAAPRAQCLVGHVARGAGRHPCVPTAARR